MSDNDEVDYNEKFTIDLGNDSEVKKARFFNAMSVKFVTLYVLLNFI